MKKIIIGLFLCLSSQIVFAESISMLDLKETTCENTSTVGNGTSTSSVGDFKIETSCISGKANSIFTIKDSQVSKDNFYKQLTLYRQKGDTCTSDLVPSKESVVGSKKFKEVCSAVGVYGTYFIDGKAVETYEVFFNALMAEALSKTPSLNDILNFGLPCQTASTTIDVYGDKVFKTVCTENDYSNGNYAKYYINNKETPYKTFNIEEIRLMNESCEEGKFSTTTAKFKDSEFKIICSGKKGLGKYLISNKAVSFNEYDNAYKAKIDTKESPETSISSSSDSFKSNLTITPTQTTSCLISTRNFKPLGLGMETSNVRAVQERLKTLKYLSATPNGYYGKGTTNAVKAFQKDKKITITGMVGPKTLQALNTLCDSGTVVSTPLDSSSSISDHIRGLDSSKFILLEYGEYQTSFPSSTSNYETVILDLIRKNKIKFVFKHFPLTQIHENSMIASKATEAAGLQGKFWEMHDILYAKQSDWATSTSARSRIISYASGIKLDIKKFSDDLDSKKVEDKVFADIKEATSLNINGSPTFFLNGKKVENYRSVESFKKIIEDTISK